MTVSTKAEEVQLRKTWILSAKSPHIDDDGLPKFLQNKKVLVPRNDKVRTHEVCQLEYEIIFGISADFWRTVVGGDDKES